MFKIDLWLHFNFKINCNSKQYQIPFVIVTLFSWTPQINVFKSTLSFRWIWYSNYRLSLLRSLSTDKRFSDSNMRWFNSQINYVIYYHLLILFSFLIDLIISIEESINININIELRLSIDYKDYWAQQKGFALVRKIGS